MMACVEGKRESVNTQGEGESAFPSLPSRGRGTGRGELE